jgi:hypothetical protein
MSAWERQQQQLLPERMVTACAGCIAAWECTHVVDEPTVQQPAARRGTHLHVLHTMPLLTCSQAQIQLAWITMIIADVLK